MQTALIIIDMICDLSDVDHSDRLLKSGIKTARKIAALKTKLKARKFPVIFANDNFGKWRSDFRTIVDCCTSDDVKGSEIAKILTPEHDDYFVLKPKHSAFFSTNLNLMLSELGVKKLILTGMTANQCVLFTANDAHMHDYELGIPRDCVVARNERERKAAFLHFKEVLKADVSSSIKLLRKI